MSTRPTSEPSGQARWFNWDQFNPIFAAAGAIVPPYYFFVRKSWEQQGKPVPSMTMREVVMGGVKASPTIGTIVGTQMIVQTFVEKALAKARKSGEDQPPGFWAMFGSSAIVGGISAPLLAIFNGQTMGLSPTQSLSALSPKQVAAIVTRETSFLFSLRISDPVSKKMKQIAGDNKAVEYSSAALSGGIGSLIGHPADTALTLWQKGIKVVSLQQLMRGAASKSIGVAGFSVCYKALKDVLAAAQNRIDE
ncbi:MAG: hypothetical protein JSR39_03175 [Verrucomicrobia bacterium]|nr:hypothetical protein [Verrucomicrobiota bacterium]